MSLLSLRSPAKINLFLHVLRRRDDGFHELASLFQAVSLFDTLTIGPSLFDSFTCSDPSLPVDGRNSVVMAIELFRRRTGRGDPLQFYLEKRIPLEAGLGGGSSNAATTLYALDKIFGTSLSRETLASWGGEIGSDVPFFFSSGTAYCEGRGEIVEDIAPLQQGKSCLLVKPPFGLSTAAVYGHLSLDKRVKRSPRADLKRALAGEIPYYNDLEEAACSLSPELRTFKESLFADAVLLSGSGSTFFCIGDRAVFPAGAFSAEVDWVRRTKEGWY